MPYLLDTYNIIHAAHALSGPFANLTVRSLCQWIIASPQRLKATLILDGRPKPDEPSENEFPDLDLLYSGAGITADQIIAQLIEQKQNRKKLTVVTNDRAVALHARKNSAFAISSESFLNLLLNSEKSHRQSARKNLPPQKTSPTLSPGESAHWLKEFGIQPPPESPHPPNPTDNLTDEDLKRLMGG